MQRPPWFPDWTGQLCAVVGSGPSANKEDIDKLRGVCRVVVVNTAFELAPWAEVLYACDGRWWEWYPAARRFAGLKVTQDIHVAKHHGLHRVTLLDLHDPQRNRFAMEAPGVLGRGENGGFQATNLVLQFGGRVILLLGLDYCGERWHGSHPGGRPQHKAVTLERWRDIFDAQAPALTAMGAQVINVSPLSALQAFPKMSVDDALSRFASR